jgi:hypothetical protein
MSVNTGTQSMADEPVHATIDHATVDFRIAPVLQHVTRRGKG